MNVRITVTTDSINRFITLNLLNMLEYFKTILAKVSFDRKLFEKELRKAIKSLVAEELEELKMWCYEHFGDIYRLVIDRQFILAHSN